MRFAVHRQRTLSRVRRRLAKLLMPVASRSERADGAVPVPGPVPVPAPPPWLKITEDSLGQIPAVGGEELRLQLVNAGALRALTRAGGPEHRRIVVAVTSWRAPTPGWRGSLGPVPGLVGLKITWPATEKGRVTVAVDVAEPVPLGIVAAAVIPLMMPTRSMPAFGSAEVVVDAGDDELTLAVLADNAGRQLSPEPDPEVLRGADLLLSSSSGGGEVLEVVAARDLDHAPLVDLHVHRPLGRRRPDPTAVPVSARLVPATHGWDVRADDGSLLVEVPAAHPLREASVRKLRTIDAIDLARVTDEPRLASRLVEIAAVGPVLHGAAPSLGARSGLDAQLAGALAAGAPADALDVTLRSVAQVRRVVRSHAWPAARGRHAEGLGWPQVLPTVTVLLTSRRPEAALVTLAALGAQTYDRMQVVLAMHGVPVPDLGRLDERARGLVTHVVEGDAAEPFGSLLSRASALADGVLVTKVDDDDLYGPEHVWDLVGAYLWSGAQVVGKQPEYVHLERSGVTLHRAFRTESYVPQVAGGTILLSVGDLVGVGGWRPVRRSVDRALLLRVLRAGGLLYATRGPGFVYVRHGRGHTWLADDKHFDAGVLQRWPDLPAGLVGD